MGRSILAVLLTTAVVAAPASTSPAGAGQCSQPYSPFYEQGAADPPPAIDGSDVTGATTIVPSAGGVDGRYVPGLLAPLSAHTVRVEWLNLVTQTNFAKTFNITQTQREQLFVLILQYPEKRYSHTLSASVDDTGQVQLWWQIQCREIADCPETDSHGHSFELTPKTQADEQWQNTEKHLEVIQALIASGQLPEGLSGQMPDEK